MNSYSLAHFEVYMRTLMQGSFLHQMLFWALIAVFVAIVMSMVFSAVWFAEVMQSENFRKRVLTKNKGSHKSKDIKHLKTS